MDAALEVGDVNLDGWTDYVVAKLNTAGPAVQSSVVCIPGNGTTVPNVANTLPNLITEIVLGAVLTSLVVPVLVRAQKEDADEGAAFVRRLLTLSLTVICQTSPPS